MSAARCAFGTLRGAVETVIATIQLGISIARVELLDEKQMEAINRYSKTDYPLLPTLFFEFHGDSDHHVSEQAALVQSLATKENAAGMVSSGLHGWKTGRNFGRRGTMRITPRSRSVLVVER